MGSVSAQLVACPHARDTTTCDRASGVAAAACGRCVQLHPRAAAPMTQVSLRGRMHDDATGCIARCGCQWCVGDACKCNLPQTATEEGGGVYKLRGRRRGEAEAGSRSITPLVSTSTCHACLITLPDIVHSPGVQTYARRLPRPLPTYASCRAPNSTIPE